MRHTRKTFSNLLLAICACTLIQPAAAAATTWNLGPGASIQSTLDAAVSGDVVMVAAGIYDENIDFSGKDLVVIGVGPETVIRGTGNGPVVTFAAGETRDAILDSVTVRGGSATAGGGILITDASPSIVRNFIVDNLAQGAGSGIFIGGVTAAPLIANNLIVYNRTSLGDPHAIQTSGSSPLIVNNTVAANDSNGLFFASGGQPVALNNIITRNGSRGTADTARRGRGICNFTQNAVIRYNLFGRNAKAALLQGGRDFRMIRAAQRVFESSILEGNVDGNAKFVRRRLPKRVEEVTADDFDLRGNSRAIEAGDPDNIWNNLDGSRNTAGHSGGPYAAGP